MHSEYRRLSDSDIFWRKSSTRYVGMFIVAVLFLAVFAAILIAVANKPKEVSLIIGCLAVGFVIGRISKREP